MALELIANFETRIDENGKPYTVIISEEYIEVPNIIPLEQQAEELMAQLQSVLNQINNQNGI
jgi:hypothetical protein